ncbi:MAG: outer membrane protein [Bdellovibrionales bacterium]
MRQTLISCFLLLSSTNALAGFVEVGASGSYRYTTVDEFNYSKTQSLTGSVAYYFWELSALEFSYTDGTNMTYGKTATNETYIATTRFQLTGLDLVISFAGRQDPFRPYIKFGGAYQRKKLTYEQGYFTPVERTSEGFAPTAGAGFKLAITQEFAIKLGADAWTSPISETPIRYDFAASAGISWLF